jgi:mannose/fructose/N-acetylgalactosamine-specific phosphotransferase system component IID
VTLSVMMKQATRVASGLLALAFLGVAIYFGVTGSWVTAVLFFVIFGVIELVAWVFDDSATERRDRK